MCVVVFCSLQFFCIPRIRRERERALWGDRWDKKAYVLKHCLVWHLSIERGCSLWVLRNKTHAFFFALHLFPLCLYRDRTRKSDTCIQILKVDVIGDSGAMKYVKDPPPGVSAVSARNFFDTLIVLENLTLVFEFWKPCFILEVRSGFYMTPGPCYEKYSSITSCTFQIYAVNYCMFYVGFLLSELV